MSYTSPLTASAAPLSTLAVLSVPWNAFVAAFLYYTLLALLSLGGLSPSASTVAAAYAAPVIVYGLVLVARAVRRVAAF
jgi:hypothetical protein